jgi:Flp pilus assembly protein TadG
VNSVANFGSTAMAQVLRDARGSMAIETAFVAPVLVLLSLGGFQASQVIARQTELQTAVAEAAEIALAAPSTSLTTLRDIIKTSTGITNNSQVLVTNEYRCGTTATRVATNTCGSGLAVTTYDKIAVTSSYVPKWAKFGVDSTVNYTVTRWVIVG